MNRPGGNARIAGIGTAATWIAIAAACGPAAVPAGHPAPASGWRWLDAAADEALAAVRAEDRALLLFVHAVWCPSCHELERDVFERRSGELPAGRLFGLRIDFDTDAGTEASHRFRVLHLPTVAIVDGDGREIGRIEGFEDADGWLEELRRILEGRDAAAEALARAEAHPDDPTILVEAGGALLGRGDEAGGIERLERARTLDPDDALGAWSDATRILARWHYRVRGDHARALELFREASEGCADPARVWGFRWWTALSLRALGRGDEAEAELASWVDADPDDAKPAGLLAEYRYTVGERTAEALALARRAAELDAADDWLHYLAAVLAERSGDRAGALEAIDRALALAPDEAIYQHLRERLEGTDGR
jgi:tetratricopeptide (TPR) repeat protein